MARKLSDNAILALQRAIADIQVAQEIIDFLAPDLSLIAVSAMAASTNLVGVDGVGSNAFPVTTAETRLDAIDAKLIAIIGAIPQAGVASHSAGSNLVGVDGTGSNAAPLAGMHTRLAALEAKLNEVLAKLKKSGGAPSTLALSPVATPAIPAGVDGTGSNAAPVAGSETRLDSCEASMNAIIAGAKAAGLLT